MSESTPATSVFPLRLTDFERYMFLDDAAGNAMTFPLTLTFRGRFDRDALTSAYDEARREHPLLSCVISPDGKEWRPTDRTETIRWLEGRPTAFPWTETSIDITKEPGLKFVVYQGENESRFDFLFHHCVSDGLGFILFLDTLFSRYLRNLGREIVQKEYDLARLRGRDVFNLEKPPRPVPWYRVLFSTVQESIRWLRNRPVSPVSKTPPKYPDENERREDECLRWIVAGETVDVETKHWSRSGYLYAMLDRDTTKRIVAECKRRTQTVGDYLLARLFLSLAEQPSFAVPLKDGTRRPMKPDDLLRIGVVCNMRGHDADRTPACNIISYAFPSRKIGDCVDSSDFHVGVSKELYIIKKWHVGLMFLKGLGFFSRIPGGLHRIVRKDDCLASAMLSSLNRMESAFPTAFPRDEEGRIVVGDATLLDFRQAAPSRKGTNLTVTTFSYAGTLRFHARYDAELLSGEDAAEWLASWIRRVIDDASQSQ